MKSKILKTTGITLLTLVTFVLASPWLFKGKITSLVNAQINKNLRAHVYFSGADISLFRHFPKLTIALDSLQVICVGEFQGDSLLTARQLEITCDINSLVSGKDIPVYSLMISEPRIHAVVHANGHSNWSSLKPEGNASENAEGSTRRFTSALQQYAIHQGYLDYFDERRNMHIVAVNLEQEGRGNFNMDHFNLNTRTKADAVDFNLNGAIPYQFTAKTSINVTLKVDNTSHTYSFNTDQVSFNDLKLHTEGFFQWINDSSYNMNIRFKTPSTKFKDVLSMLPTVYQKDFASIETNGQVNFNGYIKGKYDEGHFPAYHANLFVMNGYFKYPDLPVAVQNIRLGIQLDNRDGIADHKIINISEAHAEIYHDTLDMHFLLKNPVTKPFIDFAFVGKLDLSNFSQCIKFTPGTKWAGLFIADVHAKGKIAGAEKRKNEQFKSWGEFDLTDFLYSSKACPGGISVNELMMAFNSKNVIIQELKGSYLKTHLDATGSLNNLFDFALGNKPLNASMDLKADEINLRDWIGTTRDSMGIAFVQGAQPLMVPDNIDFTINAEAGKFHFDNLDLQNLSGKLLIADQTIQLQNVKANGLDGDIVLDGTYSTSESRETPDIALTYDVKGLDIQKTFLEFNTVRKILPVAKFMAGNLDAHLSLSGKLHNDMTTDLASLQGEGHVQLLSASLKDFGPLDKLSQQLDIAEIKNIPLNDVKAEFSFHKGEVTVSPFLVRTKDIVMGIGGVHGFDQSLDYDVSLNVPRNRLGSKGTLFVKNVVERAADKGIPVQLRDAVNMNVRLGGTINSPDVRADMDSAVNLAQSELKKEMDDFVNAKLDSAKRQLHKTPAPSKKQLFVQASYKSKSNAKEKKITRSAHKSTKHSKTKKNGKKQTRNYAASLKRGRSTASNSMKKHT